MATQLQIRRGTSSEVAAFTGAEGEIVVNTTNDSVHVNDGSTAGGFELARADLNNVSDTSLNAALTGNTVSALTVTSLTSSGIDVTGSISADGLTVANTAVVAGDFDGGTAATYIRLQDDTDNFLFGSNNSLGNFLIKNETADALRLSVANTGDISFYEDTGTTPKFFWDASAESLGIGTSSPASLLDVSSTGSVVSTIRSTSTSGARGAKLRLNVASTGGDDPAGTIEFTYGTGYTVAGSIAMSHTNPAMKFLTGTTERMRIDASGNVGIGITNPSSYGVFTVKSSGSSLINLDSTGGSANLTFFENGTGRFGLRSLNGSDGLAFIDGDGSTERMRIDSSGALILNNTGGDAQIYLGGSSGTNRMYLARSGADTLLWNASNGVMKFGTNDTERMSIAAGGAVSIIGSLSKGSGSFKIDHPLPAKAETHHLVHSFVEAPQADNIYRGKIDLVDGSATVNMDTAAGMTEGTYVLLNTNTQCFTSNESGWTAVKGSVSGNTLTITAQDNTCTDTISWMVVGERHDQHMIDTDWTDDNGKVIVEPLKENN